jgi:hypothetical protein
LYVGQTKNFRNRFLNHRSAITKKSNTAIGIHFNSINHSVRDLQVILIERIQGEENLQNLLDERERFWIKTLDSKNNGLNLDDGNLTEVKIPFVLKYSAISYKIKQEIDSKFPNLQALTQFQNHRIILAHQRNKNLKDKLVRATLSS